MKKDHSEHIEFVMRKKKLFMFLCKKCCMKIEIDATDLLRPIALKKDGDWSADHSFNYQHAIILQFIDSEYDDPDLERLNVFADFINNLEDKK